MARSRPAKSKIADRYVSKDDKDLIELARKRFQQAEEADREQRVRELDDLQFYAGAQWDPLVIQAREGQPANNNTNAQGLPPVPPRPCYVINKVREPVRQVLNQERAAELGVEIAAADDLGDGSSSVTPEEIQLREGLVRRIQRESPASDARSWAFQRSVISGRGFYRVMTRYVPGKSFDQEVYVDRIYNQASVSLDPAHEQPDGSDAEWGFIGTDLPWDRYLAEYGEVGDEPNKIAHASDQEWRQLGDECPGWFTADGPTRFVRIVEYWHRERIPRTLVQLADGTTEYQENLEEGGPPLGVDENGDPLKREVIDTQITWTKLDGVQVLEQTDWPGHYIPIVKVVGEELQPFDSRRRAEGMVRPARDSQRGFNVMVSKWVEQIGLAPIPPWMGAAGFDEGFEMEYATSNTRTLPSLHYNSKDLEGNPIGPPTRTSINMEIQAIAGSVQLFDAAIKSTTAVPDITNLDPRINSDKQLKRVLTQSDVATSHYLDNLSRSIRYEGLIINDLLEPIYSRKGRVVRTMTPKGETEAVMLHQPFVRHPQTKMPMAFTGLPATTTGPSGMTPGITASASPQTLTLTPDATFNVTVKVTKNAETRRQDIENTLSEFIQADPQYALPLYGDLIWKYYDGPGREELEERGQLGLAPAVQAAIQAKQSGQPTPNPQVMQLQQQIQQLAQALQSKTAEIQAKGAVDLQKTQMQEQQENQRTQQTNQTAITRAEIAASATLGVAQAKADAENFRSYVDALDTKLSHVLDLHMQKIDQVHEAQQSQLDRTHEMVQALVGHASAVQQANQQHQQALEQGVQQAAIAPQPTTDNGQPSNA